jgi:hypothetical protein
MDYAEAGSAHFLQAVPSRKAMIWQKRLYLFDIASGDFTADEIGEILLKTKN